MGYLHDLALSAGSYLSSLWKTRTIVPEYMVGGMVIFFFFFFEIYRFLEPFEMIFLNLNLNFK